MLFEPSHLEEVPLCRKAQEASTWKNQRGIQSGASFPEQAGIRHFHDSFPKSKESQIRALEKAYTNKAVLEQSKRNIIKRSAKLTVWYVKHLMLLFS